tara:strand:+ start:348 stop:512 length:165 start_codon:yes stop_codon:yes gene_type:complete
MNTYCGSCVLAVEEEGGSAEYLTELSGMALLPDHLCDRVESNGDIDCDCRDHKY